MARQNDLSVHLSMCFSKHVEREYPKRSYRYAPWYNVQQKTVQWTITCLLQRYWLDIIPVDTQCLMASTTQKQESRTMLWTTLVKCIFCQHAYVCQKLSSWSSKLKTLGTISGNKENQINDVEISDQFWVWDKHQLCHWHTKDDIGTNSLSITSDLHMDTFNE